MNINISNVLNSFCFIQQDMQELEVENLEKGVFAIRKTVNTVSSVSSLHIGPIKVDMTKINQDTNEGFGNSSRSGKLNPSRKPPGESHLPSLSTASSASSDLASSASSVRSSELSTSSTVECLELRL
jgi:hypothetical protein